jgi:hypothetical protein
LGEDKSKPPSALDIQYRDRDDSVLTKGNETTTVTRITRTKNFQNQNDIVKVLVRAMRIHLSRALKYIVLKKQVFRYSTAG